MKLSKHPDDDELKREFIVLVGKLKCPVCLHQGMILGRYRNSKIWYEWSDIHNKYGEFDEDGDNRWWAECTNSFCKKVNDEVKLEELFSPDEYEFFMDMLYQFLE
jgi:hypothetical protein